MGTLGQSLGRPGILIGPINSLFPKKGQESIHYLSRGFARSTPKTGNCSK